MKLKRLLIAVVIAAFAAGGVFAQDKPVVVGGQIFFYYGYEFKNPDSANKDKAKTDQFGVDRARINISKQFDDVWSVLLIAEGNNNAATIAAASFYLRQAALSAKLVPSDAFAITLSMGVMTNPINDVMAVRGDRWIGKDYYDFSSAMNLTNYDYAIINGVQAKIEIMKMVNIIVAFANGGVNGANNSTGATAYEAYETSGKDFIGVLNITPIQGLYINGYGAYYEKTVKTDKATATADGESQTNFGGGAGIDMMGIKAGVNVFSLNYKKEFVSGAANVENKGLLIDAYANANLKELAGVPVLLIARYAYGKDSKVDNSETQMFGFGVGYQFNANVQVALFYEHYMFKKELNKFVTAPAGTANYTGFGEGARQVLYVKAEAKY